MGSSLVEEDDCNNFRKEKGLQKASKGVLEEVRGPKRGELEEHRRKFGEPQTELEGPQKEL